MRGPITLIQDSVAYVRKHAALLFGTYALPALIASFVYANVTNGLPAEAEDMTASDLQLLAFSTIIFIVISVFVSLALLRAVTDPQGTTIEKAYRYSLKHFLPFIYLSALVGIVTMLGFVALIIPGILLMVWFMFAQFCFVDDGKRGVDAMRASRELVRGKWWAAFGRSMALVGIAIAAIIPVAIILGISFGNNSLAANFFSEVLTVIITPVAVAYMYFLYLDLKKVRSAA